MHACLSADLAFGGSRCEQDQVIQQRRGKTLRPFGCCWCCRLGLMLARLDLGGCACEDGEVTLGDVHGLRQFGVACTDPQW